MASARRNARDRSDTGRADMTPAELIIAAGNAVVAGTKITLIMRKGWRSPPKFPRGELLCENPTTGGRAYSHDPVKLLKWLRAEFQP